MSERTRRNPSRDALVEALKIPPHSIPAEQGVLGSLLLDRQTWDKVADFLTENDFYRRDHQLIFKVIKMMAEDYGPLDVITLEEALKRMGWLEECGGLPFLASLVKDTPSAVNILAYAEIVRQKSVLRQLISTGGEIADLAYYPLGRDALALIEDAEQKVFHIADQYRRQGTGFKPIRPLVAAAVNRIELLFHKEGHITGTCTGFTDLDEKTSGLQASDLIIVAGRPSMGKTSFCMNIAEHVAIHERLPVAVFSMEMPAEQLVLRMLSSLGRIDQSRVRTGKMEDDDWPRITSALNILAETKLFIDDTPAMTPTEVRARCRRLAREQGGKLGLVVLDYLQLMQSPGSDNRVNEISDISRSLKIMAKELNVPVIALSQLNRSLEQRPNKRPLMSDLRESGAIEQDADLILFIYRDEVYNADSQEKGTAEIIIAKQRNGPIGSLRLTFQGQYTRFENHIGNAYALEGPPRPQREPALDPEPPPDQPPSYDLPSFADPADAMWHK
jgi:replicative DNA helicase